MKRGGSTKTARKKQIPVDHGASGKLHLVSVLVVWASSVYFFGKGM